MLLLSVLHLVACTTELERLQPNGEDIVLNALLPIFMLVPSIVPLISQLFVTNFIFDVLLASTPVVEKCWI